MMKLKQFLTEKENPEVEKPHFTADEAKEIGTKLGIDWETAEYDVEQFRIGMDVELEHGKVNPITNVTDDDPIKTGKIALAHLNESSNYYTLLLKMEKDGKKTKNPIVEADEVPENAKRRLEDQIKRLQKEKEGTVGTDDTAKKKKEAIDRRIEALRKSLERYHV